MLHTDDRLAFARTASRLPLVWRDLEGPFACITNSLPNGKCGGTKTGQFANTCEFVSPGEFISQCQQLAERLPARQYVLNLCENPYLFTLALCAALLRGQTTLLPQNRSPETLRRLGAEYASSYILNHSKVSSIPELECVNFAEWDLSVVGAIAASEVAPRENALPEKIAIPEIDADFVAAIAFTSGSTGAPKPIVKSWKTLVVSTLMNGACMLPDATRIIYQLATVPPQHMWGLETGVLMPLFWPICAADSRPLFAQNIVQALAALPEPKVLVSTPVHLRAVVNSGLSIPQCRRILCATAPLSNELATACELGFRGDLLEIYGCSEIGSTAYRRPTVEPDWRLIPGLYFISPEESVPRIGGDHLPAEQVLQDRIEIHGDRFRLLGRNEDMVNVAGKRGSLMEITQVLLEIPGVLDAVAFLPESAGDNPVARPVALVVCREISREYLQQRFVERLDPVFMPRPLLFVNQLPREENGKLHREKLLALYRERLGQPAKP